MKITSSLPALHDQSFSSNASQTADERRDKSSAIAEQLDRIGQQFKASSLLTKDNKQAAAQKAGVLKHRLEQLKAMMRFATPELAQSLARELKNIAKELASLGGAAGANGSEATLMVAAPGGEVSSETSTEISTPTENSTATAASDAGGSVDGGNALPGSGGQNADRAEGEGGAETRAGADDTSLREIVQEARKLLKELIARVKSLARHGNADARRDLRAAEDSVAELDRALDGGGDPVPTSDVDGSAAQAVGGNIDVSV